MKEVIKVIPLFGIKEIVNDFYNMLETDANKFYRYVPFFFLPLILSLFIAIFIEYKIEINYLNPLLTAITILVGFLFNMVLIMYEISDKKELNNFDSVKIRHTYFSLIYSLMIGLIIVTEIIVVTIVKLFDWNLVSPYFFIQYAASFILYFLLIHFSITLFMVLKRVHSVIKIGILK